MMTRANSQTKDTNGSTSDGQQPGNRLHQSALPRTVRSHQSKPLAYRQRKTDTMEKRRCIGMPRLQSLNRKRGRVWIGRMQMTASVGERRVFHGCNAFAMTSVFPRIVAR